MNPYAKKIIEAIVPRSYHLALRYKWLSFKGALDSEMFYVDSVLEKHRRFLDVGSNIGIYAYYFSNKFENVDAFEPIKEITYRIQALRRENINLHNEALSNESASLEFYMPIRGGGPEPALASLEQRDKPFEQAHC
jgi:hypothetical protein